MAQMNIGRYERLASQAFGVKGPGTLGMIENSIFATFPVDTGAPVEFWQEQNIQRYMSYEENAAVAGQFGGIQVRNIEPDMLTVIERIHLGPSTATNYVGVFIGDNVTTNYFPTPMEGFPLDTRNPRAGTYVPGTEGTVAGFPPPNHNQVFSAYLGIGGQLTLDFPVVLGQWGAIILQATTANILTRFAIEYHVRPIGD